MYQCPGCGNYVYELGDMYSNVKECDCYIDMGHTKIIPVANSYRILNEGEEIKEGDEFYHAHSHEWLIVDLNDVGDKINHLTPPVKRKIRSWEE